MVFQGHGTNDIGPTDYTYKRRQKTEKLLKPRERVENDASVRLTNLSLDLYDLDLDPIPKVGHFMPLPHGPLVPICSQISSFVFKTSFSQVW